MVDPVLVPASTLGDLPPDQLAVALAPLWERAGPLVSRLVGRRFASWDDLIDAAETEIAAMSADDRRALLASHPRIGADPSTLAARSVTSYREQGGAGEADPAVLRRLDELNIVYELRFGFPFVAWVAGRSRSEMVEVLEQRLTQSRAEELATGCAALVSIARDRLAQRANQVVS